MSDLFNSSDEALDAIFVLAAIILDVQYAMLMISDPDKAKKLVELHESGGVIGPDITFDPTKFL